MVLNELLYGVKELQIPENITLQQDISGVCYDSRRATADSLFVCIKGALSDGHFYARSAYDRGCRFFLAQMPLSDLPADAHVLLCPDTRRALAELSTNLFRHPARELHIIGITGTKGKTTTALLIYNILNACGIPCGYIGTSGVKYGSFHFESANTTPESYVLHEYMRNMRRAGVTHLVMEVSSQALYLGRVHGIPFHTAVFTNLSEDHIGEHEHPTFEHYKACKKALFTDHNIQYALLNADDPYCEEFAACVPQGVRTERYAIRADKSDYLAVSVERFKQNNCLGTAFTCKHHGTSLSLSQSFPGTFSVYNALAALAVCRNVGISDEDVARELAGISIAGRFELVKALPYATFIIDYAHNRVSLTSALQTLRAYEPKRLICLFGSVGGRTFARRAELGSVAAELADFSILTSDNPDDEDPQNILREIATQFRGNTDRYVIIPDRAEAIRHAVSIAKEGDVFLFAGKGHERYQLICGERRPFCERDILLAECAKKLDPLPS